jgi:hypothetical protein
MVSVPHGLCCEHSYMHFMTFSLYFVRLSRKPGAELAQSVRRWATDRIAGVQFQAGEKDFSLFRSVQTGYGAHLASYPMGTVGSFPGGKAAGV